MASLYSCAANVVDKVIKKQGTAKSLVINSPFPRKKKLYALVCETLKYKGILEEIFKETKLLKLEKKLKHNYALVLVYDFLFGQGIQGGGEFKRCILKNKSVLQSCLARMKVRAKVHRNEDLLPKKAHEAGSIPRYIRINRIKTSVEEVIKHFKENDYQQVQLEGVDAYIQKSKESTASKQFMCDVHLPDVLIFPPGTDLHNHPLYISGLILLQDKVRSGLALLYPANNVQAQKDKASCLPAHVLDPPAGSHVIDSCAAPGNKSSHLASLMNNQGNIFSFDTDRKRLAVMQRLMKTAGASCVTTSNCSFLEVDPVDEKYSKVEYIVVDPSCSGSGIVSRMDNLVNEDQATEDEMNRLESLAKFQLSVLNHALSFPFVKRVVYSTCSVHQKENEDVVEAALRRNCDRFTLEHCLPSWIHRGLPVFPGAEKCIRASPSVDYTNGFFVALFARKDLKMEQKVSTDGSTVSTGRKRKLTDDGVVKKFTAPSSSLNGDDSLISPAIVKTGSSNVDFPPRKKRRKRKKNQKQQAETQIMEVIPSLGKPKGGIASIDNKRNRKKKRKNKKVPVCLS